MSSLQAAIACCPSLKLRFRNRRPESIQRRIHNFTKSFLFFVSNSFRKSTYLICNFWVCEPRVGTYILTWLVIPFRLSLSVIDSCTQDSVSAAQDLSVTFSSPGEGRGVMENRNADYNRELFSTSDFRVNSMHKYMMSTRIHRQG